jgi:hypothetical protein
MYGATFFEMIFNISTFCLAQEFTFPLACSGICTHHEFMLQRQPIIMYIPGWRRSVFYLRRYA